jgi:phosphopantetheinyl transferase
MWLSEPEPLLLTEGPDVPEGVPRLFGDHLLLLLVPIVASLPEAPFLACLHPDERGRTEAIRHPHARAAFLQGRARLRCLLGRELDLPAAEVPLILGPHGKPEHAGGSIDFNLSHTASWLLIGMTKGAAIGVDLEGERRFRDLDRLIGSVFSEFEQKGFEGLTEAEKTNRFHEGWTVKEAYAKAVGKGIALGLERIEYDAEGMKFSALPEEAPSEVQLRLGSYSDHRLALVYQGPERVVRFVRALIQ